MKTCQVIFEASGAAKPYTYGVGRLAPQPGQWVVVLVGKEARKKIVQCVGTSTEEDDIVTSTIFGIIQEQPKP